MIWIGNKNLWFPLLIPTPWASVKEGRSLQNHCHFVRIFFSKTTRENQQMGQQFWLLWKNISLNKSSARDCFSICTHTFYSTSLLVATKHPCIIYPTTFSFSSKWYCKNVLQFQRIINNYIQFPIWQMAHQPMCWWQTSVMLGILHHRSAICWFYSLNNP